MLAKNGSYLDRLFEPKSDPHDAALYPSGDSLRQMASWDEEVVSVVVTIEVEGP